MAGFTLPESMSHSALSTALHCGRVYEQRYILGRIVPPGAAAHRGHGIHAASELNFRQKKLTGVDLNQNLLTEIAVEAFEERLRDEVVWLSPEDESRGKDIIVAEEKDTIPSYMGQFATRMAPRVTPTEVEIAAAVSVSPLLADGTVHPMNLTGRLDLIGQVADVMGQNGVVDLKSSGRKKGQSKVDNDDQLTMYVLLALRNGLLQGELADVPLVMATVTPKDVEFILTHRTQRRVDAMLARMEAVIRGIAAGALLPADPARDFLCSRNWCGYSADCPYLGS